MNRSITKKSFHWIATIFIFFIAFYLSSQRVPSEEQKNLSTLGSYSVKQKLADDFETAFLKQYTPLVGCEDLESATQSDKCNQHIKQAKNSFKQQFIKNRGLPKMAFEELKLSFSD